MLTIGVETGKEGGKAGVLRRKLQCSPNGFRQTIAAVVLGPHDRRTLFSFPCHCNWPGWQGHVLSNQRFVRLVLGSQWAAIIRDGAGLPRLEVVPLGAATSAVTFVTFLAMTHVK